MEEQFPVLGPGETRRESPSAAADEEMAGVVAMLFVQVVDMCLVETVADCNGAVRNEKFRRFCINCRACVSSRGGCGSGGGSGGCGES